MNLSTLWRTDQTQLLEKQLHQIIAFAGEGHLADGGTASVEFREFLNLVPLEYLRRYIEECLSERFNESGLALQDLVNQIGRRLGYSVTDGRYRGSSSEVANDGLWRLPDGHAVVVEVKTTSAFTVDVNRIADYRRRLITLGTVAEDDSSVLIVVGREDTPGLEAQIRGSRHAWDIRLISVDALLRLVALREKLDDPATIGRIGDILKPREYTRLDDIVDLVFSAAEEAAEDDDYVEPDGDSTAIAESQPERSSPVSFHAEVIRRVELTLAQPLLRRSRSGYSSADNATGVVCAVSKTHTLPGRTAYWFAFHPHQRDFLKSHAGAYLVLGCGSAETVLCVPFAELDGWLSDLWTTDRGEGRYYWHLRIVVDGTRLQLERKGGKSRIELSRYLVKRVGAA